MTKNMIILIFGVTESLNDKIPFRVIRGTEPKSVMIAVGK